jgi:adenylate cyclase class 2
LPRTIGALDGNEEQIMYEVESKYWVTDFPPIEAILAKYETCWREPVAQRDLYFAHPARDFAATDEALRLRVVGEENCVTYKGPKLDATTKTRREIEIPLAAGSMNAAGFCEILKLLGFKPVREVRKVRRAACLTYAGWPVDIALDEVDGLGRFVEIELTAETGSLEDARQVLEEIAEELGLTDGVRESYLELLIAHEGS